MCVKESGRGREVWDPVIRLALSFITKVFIGNLETLVGGAPQDYSKWHFFSGLASKWFHTVGVDRGIVS